jgi:ketosteroid isomerase-like protein
MKARKTAIAGLFAFLLLTFTSCENTANVQPQLQSSLKNTDIKEKIESINHILEKAALENNFEIMAKYYADDIIVAPGTGPVVKGLSAVRKSYSENKKMEVKYHSFSAKVEEVWECSGEIFERGTFGMSYSYKNHPNPEALYGSYFTVWQKEGDNSLKIKYVIWNLGFNPF